MEEQINNFIEYLRNIKKYSDYTETNYLIDIEKFSEYLTKKRISYKKITYKEINDYIKYLKEIEKLNSSSINRHLSSLRSFYNYLLNQQTINNNPFKLITSQKVEQKLPNYMKYDEFNKMVETCDSTPLGIRNRCLLELLLATGARIGELINLKVSDINLSNMELKVLGKGNKERICYFTNITKSSIEAYLSDSREILLKGKKSDYMFINHLGNKLTDRGVRDIIDKIIQKSALNAKITPHTFRHTFATMLLNEGCELKSVQELLGHANLSTTTIYTHLTSDHIKDIYLHAHPRSK